MVHYLFFGRERPPQTGGERYQHEVISCLRSQGMEVGIVDWDEIPHQVRKSPLLCNLWFILKFQKAESVCFVVNNYWRPWLFLFNQVMRRRGAARIVATVYHLYHPLWPQPWMRALDKLTERWFLRAAHRVVVISHYSWAAVERLGIPSECLVLIPPGLDLGPALGHPDPVLKENGMVRLLYVGGLNQRKGLSTLLDAMPRLDSQVVLDLVGDTRDSPEYVRRLRQRAKELSLDGRVHFHGYLSLPDLHQLYSSSDIFVLPSLEEGFGIVLLEAMRFALPIVANRAGAIPELVHSGMNGLLVPPRDPDSLAEALERLIASPNLRRQYGSAGYRQVQAWPTWAEVGEQFVRVLTSLEADDVR